MSDHPQGNPARIIRVNFRNRDSNDAAELLKELKKFLKESARSFPDADEIDFDFSQDSLAEEVLETQVRNQLAGWLNEVNEQADAAQAAAESAPVTTPAAEATPTAAVADAPTATPRTATIVWTVMRWLGYYLPRSWSIASKFTELPANVAQIAGEVTKDL